MVQVFALQNIVTLQELWGHNINFIDTTSLMSGYVFYFQPEKRDCSTVCQSPIILYNIYNK